MTGLRAKALIDLVKHARRMGEFVDFDGNVLLVKRPLCPGPYIKVSVMLDPAPGESVAVFDPSAPAAMSSRKHIEIFVLDRYTDRDGRIVAGYAGEP